MSVASRPLARLHHVDQPKTGRTEQKLRVALDGMAIKRSGRGVSRVLRQVFPLMASTCEAEYFVLTTAEGRELLGDSPVQLLDVPSMPHSLWEQSGLPAFARRYGADLIYSHAECAPLWGPDVLLHVPEDPYLRWETAFAEGWREQVRRRYERLAMEAGLRRARALVVSCEAVGSQLRRRFGWLPETFVVPLGVDTSLFRPGAGRPSEDMIFHLGSSERRDQTMAVVEAYAKALATTPDLPQLVIAGALGCLLPEVLERADALGVEKRLELLGAISDEDLRTCYYQCALCVQPAIYEGFGLQPLEALACGAPLIVVAEPAVQTVVSGAARVVNSADDATLSGAISELWADRAERARLREAGQARAAQFPWSATAERLHTLLLGVWGEHTRERAPSLAG